MEEDTEGETTGIGTAKGMWNGKAFSYTFSNIEHVSGGPGLDILVGSDGDDTFEGRGYADLFVVGDGEKARSSTSMRTTTMCFTSPTTWCQTSDCPTLT